MAKLYFEKLSNLLVELEIKKGTHFLRTLMI